MHNLAIALNNKGYHVTGSDDAIFSPSKERLEEHSLLPKKTGWDTSNITSKLYHGILRLLYYLYNIYTYIYMYTYQSYDYI